jgi:PEP-CTERM motif
MYMRFSSLGKLAVLALGVGMGLSSHAFADGISATATFTDTPDASLAGVNDYSITLNNTGTTTIGTFWFGWVPGNGFLSATPTDIGTPAGWTEMTTNGGAAVQFVTSTPLAAGSSLSGFTFDSTETPAELMSAFTGMEPGTGDPESTAFVYSGAPLVGIGDQLVVTAAPAAVTPEPSTLALFGTGILGLAGAARRKLLNT